MSPRKRGETEGSPASSSIVGVILMSELVYESKATYDGVTKIVTIGFIVLCGSLGVLLSPIIQEPVLILLPYLILIAVVVILFLYAPLGFLLTDSGLVIKRPVGSIKIPYSEIVEAHYRPGEWAWWRLRLWGSGGFLGFFSLCWDKKHGRHRVHITNRHNLVVVKTCGRETFMISPVNPEEFVERLNRACQIVKTLNERFHRQNLTNKLVFNCVNHSQNSSCY